MNNAEASTSGAPAEWPLRKVEMSEADFGALMLAYNVASNALDVLREHPEIEILDLDGDPFPEARERWQTAIERAAKAITRTNYAGVAERRYKHDCERCSFVGKLRQYDIYVHLSGFPTIVARYGDDGPEYQSSSKLRLHDLSLVLELDLGG